MLSENKLKKVGRNVSAALNNRTTLKVLAGHKGTS